MTKFLIVITCALLLPLDVHAQSRVNLEDVKIDGELQKEGLSLSSRQRFSIEGEIQVRESFKDLTEEYLPPGYRALAQESPAK